MKLATFFSALGMVVTLMPIRARADSRRQIHIEHERFDAKHGLDLRCRLHSYRDDGPWAVWLRLPFSGVAPPTQVLSLRSPSVRDPDFCRQVAELAGPPRAHKPLQGTATRRVFDVFQTVGDRCVRSIEETYELKVDGWKTRLEGSVRFRIGESPMRRCS